MNGSLVPNNGVAVAKPLMMKIEIQISLIVLALSPEFLLSQAPKLTSTALSKAYRRTISISTGRNVAFLDGRYEYSISSLDFSPIPGKTGFGVKAGIVKERGFSPDDFVYILPALFFQSKRAAFILGFNNLITKGGKGHIVLPSIAVRFGNLNKLFVAFEVLADWFYSPICFRCLYSPSQDTSVSIGTFYSLEDYDNGYLCSLQFPLWKSFGLKLDAVSYFNSRDYGLGCGLVYFLR